MAGRIGVHVTLEQVGSELNDGRPRRLDIVDHDVEVELLGYSLVGPRRRDVVGNALKGEP